MALESDVLESIETLVRGGFESRDTIVEIISEEMHEPGELDADEVAEAVDAALRRLESEKAHWPAVTDCDRLNAAFAELNLLGIIALQNAGYTQSDGYDDIREVYAAKPDRSGVQGYCFYQGQDLERAVNGDGLYLAFGPIDPKLEETDGARIGELIRGVLVRHGFAVAWNGSFEQRMSIPQIDWQRR